MINIIITFIIIIIITIMTWCSSIWQIQMTMVRSVSRTFLVVALMYLVMDTPEKLKKAMETMTSTM